MQALTNEDLRSRRGRGRQSSNRSDPSQINMVPTDGSLSTSNTPSDVSPGSDRVSSNIGGNPPNAGEVDDTSNSPSSDLRPFDRKWEKYLPNLTGSASDDQARSLARRGRSPPPEIPRADIIKPIFAEIYRRYRREMLTTRNHVTSIEHLTQKMTALIKDNAKLHSEKETLNRELENGKTDRHHIEMERDRLEKEHKDLHQRLEVQTANVAAQRQEINHSDSDRIHLQKQLDTMQSTLDDLRDEQEELNRLRVETSKVTADLKEALLDNKNLSEALDEAEKAMGLMRDREIALEQILDAREQDLADHNRLLSIRSSFGAERLGNLDDFQFDQMSRASTFAGSTRDSRAEPLRLSVLRQSLPASPFGTIQTPFSTSPRRNVVSRPATIHIDQNDSQSNQRQNRSARPQSMQPIGSSGIDRGAFNTGLRSPESRSAPNTAIPPLLSAIQEHDDRTANMQPPSIDTDQQSWTPPEILHADNLQSARDGQLGENNVHSRTPSTKSPEGRVTLQNLASDTEVEVSSRADSQSRSKSAFSPTSLFGNALSSFSHNVTRLFGQSRKNSTSSNSGSRNPSPRRRRGGIVNIPNASTDSGGYRDYLDSVNNGDHVVQDSNDALSSDTRGSKSIDMADNATVASRSQTRNRDSFGIVVSSSSDQHDAVVDVAAVTELDDTIPASMDHIADPVAIDEIPSISDRPMSFSSTMGNALMDDITRRLGAPSLSSPGLYASLTNQQSSTDSPTARSVTNTINDYSARPDIGTSQANTTSLNNNQINDFRSQPVDSPATLPAQSSRWSISSIPSRASSISITLPLSFRRNPQPQPQPPHPPSQLSWSSSPSPDDDPPLRIPLQIPLRPSKPTIWPIHLAYILLLIHVFQWAYTERQKWFDANTSTLDQVRDWRYDRQHLGVLSSGIIGAVGGMVDLEGVKLDTLRRMMEC